LVVRRLVEEISVVGETDEIAELTDLSVAQAEPELEPKWIGDRSRHD
jgi:hypothetical protein